MGLAQKTEQNKTKQGKSFTQSFTDFAARLGTPSRQLSRAIAQPFTRSDAHVRRQHFLQFGSLFPTPCHYVQNVCPRVLYGDSRNLTEMTIQEFYHLIKSEQQNSLQHHSWLRWGDNVVES